MKAKREASASLEVADRDSPDAILADSIRRYCGGGEAAALLRLGCDVGPLAREALADLLEGKIKRPAGRQPRSDLERFKDLNARAPWALWLLDSVAFSRRRRLDLGGFPLGGPSKGETTREYVARVLGMSETALENLLKFAASKGVRLRKP